jgi:hypothetical protein
MNKLNNAMIVLILIIGLILAFAVWAGIIYLATGQ